MIEFRLLGSVDLKGPDGETLRPILTQAKRLALLAYLSVASPRGFHRRDKLLGLFWPDSDADHARGSLRNSVYFLRRHLGEGVIESRGEEEVGLAAEAILCDAVAFEHALERGEAEKAIELYRGDLLDGFYVSGLPEFERWVETERQRLFDACAGALEKLAEEAEAAGDHRRAVDWWKRAISHDPYNSRYALRLMEALAVAGDRGNALQFAQEHQRRLSEELGMEPDEELLALAERLRRDWGQEHEPLGRETPTDIDEDRSGSRVAPVTWLTWRRGLGIGTLAVALAIAIVAVVRESGGPDTGEALSSNRVAVLPFTVRGADDLTYLGEGMVDLMSTALDGAGELRAVDSYALLSFLKRTEEVTGPEEAGRVARHFGAGLYVLGSIVAAGDRIHVSAALYDLEANVVRRAETRVDDEAQLFDVVDDLSRQLLAVGAGGPGTRLSTLAARTTQSIPALKEYLRGENAYRGGQFDSAVAAFQRAVAADSTFALGYYRLAVAGGYAGVLTAADQLDAIRRAVRYKDRLADRDRALVEAEDAYRRGAAAEAERRFRSIVWRYPNDVDAWHSLGRVLTNYAPVLVRPISQRRAARERILALDPDHVQATFGLASVAADEGKIEEAQALLERWLELAPDADLAVARRAALAYAREDRAEQGRILAELRGARTTVANFAFRTVFPYSGTGAIEIARLYTEPSRSPPLHVLGHTYIAMTHLALGRWEAAKAELDWAEPPDVSPQWSALTTRVTLSVSAFLPLPRRELDELRSSLEQLDSSSTWVRVTRPYLAGLLSVRLEDYDAAVRSAGQLDAYAAAPDSGRFSAEWAALARDWALSVRAHAAWRAGQSGQALALLDQTEPERWFGALRNLNGFFLSYRAPELYLGAELLRGLGRDEEALIWYESLVATGLLNEVYLVPSHYRRAEIYERLGNPGEAARHYRRVIEIWKDADPELQPWVEAARRAMEALSPDR